MPKSAVRTRRSHHREAAVKRTTKTALTKHVVGNNNQSSSTVSGASLGPPAPHTSNESGARQQGSINNVQYGAQPRHAASAPIENNHARQPQHQIRAPILFTAAACLGEGPSLKLAGPHASGGLIKLARGNTGDPLGLRSCQGFGRYHGLHGMQGKVVVFLGAIAVVGCPVILNGVNAIAPATPLESL